MIIKVQDLAKQMTLAGVKSIEVNKIMKSLRDQKITQIEGSSEQLQKMAKKIAGSKNKEQLRLELSERCKNFSNKTKNVLGIIILALVITVGVSIFINLGMSLVSRKEDSQTTSTEVSTEAPAFAEVQATA
jgi:hypothetical protein